MDMVWLKSHRRKPVRLENVGEPDRQARLPIWWCEQCGMEVCGVEVFGAGRLCDACEAERRIVYERNKTERNKQPVFDLYPRSGSGTL